MNPVSNHCPLCVSIPAADLKKSAIIFLDLDGVMIDHRSHQQAIATKAVEIFGENRSNLQRRIAAVYSFDEVAMQSLKLLIERIEKVKPAYIVICSAWREECTLDELKNQVFGLPGFEILKEKIIGKTPSPKDESWVHESCRYLQKNTEKKVAFEDLSEKKYGFSFYNRKGEISFWLAFHKIDDCDFIVFDDERNGLTAFEKRFVQVDPCKLLSGKDVDLAMNAIFQENKLDCWETKDIKKEHVSQISMLLPKRFVNFKQMWNYFDESVGLNLVSHIAEKTAEITAKFLTAKGHLKKSIRPKFISEPTEFPDPDKVLKFIEEAKKFLFNHFKQALKEDNTSISFSVHVLPEGDLEKLLKLADISLKTYPEYGCYFPLDMKIEFKHAKRDNGGGSFKCLMDY